MKVIAAASTVLLSLTLFIAVVLGGGDTPTLYACGGVAGGDQISAILATIRTIESGGRYDSRITTATASGAYAFIDTAWRYWADLADVDTQMYPSAWMAPPADQDAAATAYVNQILTDHQGRVEIIPIAWYLPSAIDHPAQMDVVPMPEAGNRLTPRQYQTKWMTEYQRQLQRVGITGTPPTIDVPPTSSADVAAPPTTAAPNVPGGCHGGAITPLGGDWSLPGPRTLLDANPEAINSPHHDYAAWDWLIPENTAIYAIHGGVVRTVHTWPHNWWTQGCTQTVPGGCDTCGVGVTIIDTAGTHWTYCHGNNLTVQLGDTVTAGQQILWSGNNGRSGAPHVHVEIRTNGIRRCPQPLIQSLYYNGTGIDPNTLPTSGCSI